MLNLHSLAVLTAFGILAIGLGASGKPSVSERINNATADLKEVEAVIPQEKLHARAVEILRSMTVAKGGDQ
jgi:hypothetical protein